MPIYADARRCQAAAGDYDADTPREFTYLLRIFAAALRQAKSLMRRLTYLKT